MLEGQGQRTADKGEAQGDAYDGGAAETIARSHLHQKRGTAALFFVAGQAESQTKSKTS